MNTDYHGFSLMGVYFSFIANFMKTSVLIRAFPCLSVGKIRIADPVQRALTIESGFVMID